MGVLQDLKNASEKIMGKLDVFSNLEALVTEKLEKKGYTELEDKENQNPAPIEDAPEEKEKQAPEGEVRELTEDELEQLKQLEEMEKALEEMKMLRAIKEMEQEKAMLEELLA